MGKNNYKLRTLYPRNHESFKNSKSYYKKRVYRGTQLYILVKLTIQNKRLKKHHYCLHSLPHSFSVFNNISSYLSFLKQQQIQKSKVPTNHFFASLFLLHIFPFVDVAIGCYFGKTFVSHHIQCISVALLVFPFGFSWVSHVFSTSNQI